MNKNLVLIVVAVLIIILVGVGYYFMSGSEDNIPNLSNDTVLFDYSKQSTTNWNENTHEYKFHQKITSANNQDVENINMDIIFYNHGEMIGIKSNTINHTVNGAFDLDFTIKLDSEPDEFYYNVTDVNWV